VKVRAGRGEYGGWFLRVGRFNVRGYRVTLRPHRCVGVHFSWSLER
jgi:hypothetical protein